MNKVTLPVLRDVPEELQQKLRFLATRKDLSVAELRRQILADNVESVEKRLGESLIPAGVATVNTQEDSSLTA